MFLWGSKMGSVDPGQSAQKNSFQMKLVIITFITLSSVFCFKSHVYFQNIGDESLLHAVGYRYGTDDPVICESSSSSSSSSSPSSRDPLFGWERFLGIPYSLPTDQHCLPTPVDYQNHSCSDSDNCINPEGKLYVCPESGAFSMPLALKVILGDHVPVPDATKYMQLDIYRQIPTSEKSSMKRVIFYIHGGFLDSESRLSPLYNPKNLISAHPEVDKDCIVVAPEYGLGPYGFWHVENNATTMVDGKECLPYGAPISNRALHEVTQALLWVQRYISNFGGDPNNVTIIGHSAGATIAHYLHLFLDNRIINLYGFKEFPFNKMLLMSGTAILFDAHLSQEAETMQMKVLNYQKDPTAEEVPFFTLPTEIMKNNERFQEACMAGQVLWKPVVDDFLVTDKPSNLLSKKKNDSVNKKVRVCATVTSEDARLFLVCHANKIKTGGLETLMEFDQQELYDKLQGKTIIPSEMLKMFGVFCTDAFFRLPALQTITAYKSWGIKTWHHEFNINLLGHVRPFLMKKIDETRQAVNSKSNRSLTVQTACSAFQYGFSRLTGISASSNEGHRQNAKEVGLWVGKSALGLLSSIKMEPKQMLLAIQALLKSSESSTSIGIVSYETFAEYLCLIPENLIDIFIDLVQDQIALFGCCHGIDQLILLAHSFDLQLINMGLTDLLGPVDRHEIMKPIVSFIISTEDRDERSSKRKGSSELSPKKKFRQQSSTAVVIENEIEESSSFVSESPVFVEFMPVLEESKLINKDSLMKVLRYIPTDLLKTDYLALLIEKADDPKYKRQTSSKK